jgi:hypothetical protein
VTDPGGSRGPLVTRLVPVAGRGGGWAIMLESGTVLLGSGGRRGRWRLGRLRSVLAGGDRVFLVEVFRAPGWGWEVTLSSRGRGRVAVHFEILTARNGSGFPW